MRFDDEIWSWAVRREDRLISLRLTAGLSGTVDVRPPRDFAVGLLLSTGSAAHVRRLKDRAQKRGLTLDELSGQDETVLYSAVGLSSIPAELRIAGGLTPAAKADEATTLMSSIPRRSPTCDPASEPSVACRDIQAFESSG
jgi:hypothetical protein